MKDTIGCRFNIFRRLVAKSIIEFSSEASLPLDLLTGLEKDRDVNPGILDFKYFCDRYGLNMTWLLTGKGKIFFKKGMKTPLFAFMTDEIVEYNPNAYDKFLAVINDGNKSQMQKESELMVLYNENYER